MIDDDIRALRDDAAKLRTFVGPWLGDGQHANVNGYALSDRIARLLDEVERLRAENDLLRTENDEAAEIVADLKAEVSAVAREAQTLRNQRDELRIILDKRPAMNEGLREAYAKWSAGVYALDWMDAADIDAAHKEEGK